MTDVLNVLKQAKRLRLEAASGFNPSRPDETSGNSRGMKIKLAKQLERLAVKVAASTEQR